MKKTVIEYVIILIAAWLLCELFNNLFNVPIDFYGGVACIALYKAIKHENKGQR